MAKSRAKSKALQKKASKKVLKKRASRLKAKPAKKRASLSKAKVKIIGVRDSASGKFLAKATEGAAVVIKFKKEDLPLSVSVEQAEDSDETTSTGPRIDK